MSRLWASALLVVLSVGSLSAQSSALWTDESGVGSERDFYARLLVLVQGRDDARDHSKLALDPWASTKQATSGFRWTRPQLAVSENSSFPWQVVDAGVWEGRGVNALVSAGAAYSRPWVSLKVEPLFATATNQSFRLENPGVGFRNAERPATVDEPQRFGARAYALVDAGESAVRFRLWHLAAAVSNERLFWGPGVRHSLLLSGRAPRFPHLAFDIAQPVRTWIGSFSGQIIYGRLDQSDWAPSAPTKLRFASGFTAAWTPPSLPLDLGLARFYHRPWPEHFRFNDLFAPLGALFYSPNTNFTGGVTDNQLASLFFKLRLSGLAAEVFGEFGRNDRSVDVRDLALEPEHNSAWSFGFLKAFWPTASDSSFWSVRFETADAHVSAIQSVGRAQATWYEHDPITQGHTQRGMILGTPLIDRSGGFELALDKWYRKGRTGVSIFQRQMPPDLGVGIPRDAAHTQWDFRGSALRFIGPCELTLQAGVVADLNRFPNSDIGNVYLMMGWRGLRP